jgi:hypothetical protein
MVEKTYKIVKAEMEEELENEVNKYLSDWRDLQWWLCVKQYLQTSCDWFNRQSARNFLCQAITKTTNNISFWKRSKKPKKWPEFTNYDQNI